MTDRPNLLFILTDQQRRDSMACYGNSWIRTPNLDALAQQSFVFENAYVTQPVCTPARASIMTGLYPQTTGLVRNGITLDPDTRTIAEMVSDDYVRAHFGKWHLGDDVLAQHGFEHWVSLEGAHSLRRISDSRRDMEPDYFRFLRENGVEPPSQPVGYETWASRAGLPEELTPASFLGREASQFIRDHAASDSGRPFLMYVGFFEPHPPYTGPLNGTYSTDEVEVGPSFLQRPESGSLVNQLRADYYLSGHLNPLGVAGGDFHDTTTEAGWRKLRAQYFANVTLMDRAAGRILDALNESGLAEETVVVFTSEHGEMAGDHGMLEKRALYEEASRVPLLVKVPWLASGGGSAIEGSFGQIDLVPTLLDLLGEPVPHSLEGASRVAVLRDGASLRENDVFLQWNGVGDRDLGSPHINRMIAEPWRSLVTGDRWKLNLSPGDRCELYDLNTDPYEMSNLYDDPGHVARVRDMAGRIQAWLDAVGDDTPLPRI